MTKGRIEAFSDAVLAIVMTIMVLELRPPEETTRVGYSTPSACRQRSSECGPLLPTSPLPQCQNQCHV